MIARVDSRGRLTAIVRAHRITAAVAVAVELGLVDLLAEGPRTPAELASAAGTDPDATGRLLRALAVLELADEVDGTYSLAEAADPLRTDAPASLAPQALLAADPAIWAAWGHLAHSVRTGENAFSARHGVDVWTYRAQHPERNTSFNDLMTLLSLTTAEAVATSYDFSGHRHVVDVGGGHGALLAAVLRRFPDLTGTVFDQAHVVLEDPPADLADRWSVDTGSFFEGVPPADVYLLKSILHDWSDEDCVRILSRCREALSPGGVVLLVERLLGLPGHELEAAMSDLTMLVGPGGRERTSEEYGQICNLAGLRLDRVVETGTHVVVLEAVAG